MNRTKTYLIALTLLGSFLASSGLAAQESWTLTKLGGSVDEPTKDTFSQLLRTALSSRTGVPVQQSAASCDDTACAQREGAAIGSHVALFGSLGALGTETVVTVTMVDVESGTLINTQRMSVDRLEDLDSVAERMAEAFVAGTGTDETAELGNITAEEVAPDRRREGARGFGLRFGGIIPLGEAGFAKNPAGVAIDMSYWYETQQFAIAPRLGLRFSSDIGAEETFFEMPMDIGAYYILTRSDFAPFIGGGAGLRFMSQTTLENRRVGGVIAETHEAEVNDSAFGFGTFARAGILLGRTYTVRVALTVDYNIAFLKLNDQANPQSLTAGVGVFF